MAQTDENNGLIRKYLDGNLTQEEQQRMGVLMQSEDFRKEVNFQKDLKMAAVEAGRQEIREDFRKWKVETSMEQVQKPLWSSTWFKLAAALLVLVAAIFFIRSPDKDVSKQLFSAYYTPLPNLIDPLARASSSESLTPSQLFEKAEYVKALQIEPPDSLQVFYLGLCQLALSNVDESIRTLQPLADDPAYHFNEEAQWYLALAYLSDDRQSESIGELRKIVAETGHDFHRDATKLLQELQSLDATDDIR